jgi:thiamine-phosphate pyrophosphorylase
VTPRLVVLTDRSQLRLGRGLTSLLAEAREAGLTHVVLRELDLSTAQRAAQAAALTALGLTVLAAHRPVPGASGVHLPAGAAPTWGRSGRSGDALREVGRAAPVVAPWGRSRRAPDDVGRAAPVVASGGGAPHTLGEVGRAAPVAAPWGRSCHTPDEVRRAAADGAGWATLSPYAESASKPGHGPALAASAYAGLPVPTYALGGITPENAAAARAAGAHGVAVMGAVMRAAHPGEVVAALLEAVAP